LHHQTFKTSDDPFYSDKDFLHAQVFAHIRKLSPRQEKLLDTVNMKDMEEDGIVMFQKRLKTLKDFILILFSTNCSSDFTGFFTSFSLYYFQSTHHSSIGMIPYKPLFLLPSHCDTLS
jgi:stearoyl-CoA desaturase (Delta-9 desaturase)